MSRHSKQNGGRCTTAADVDGATDGRLLPADVRDALAEAAGLAVPLFCECIFAKGMDMDSTAVVVNAVTNVHDWTGPHVKTTLLAKYEAHILLCYEGNIKCMHEIMCLRKYIMELKDRHIFVHTKCN